jgi:ABC-type phosphate/phosphonate transport system ATPase subunit
VARHPHRHDVIATCRNGSFVLLVAPSGAGKSTLARQLRIDHALHVGPAIYLTYELDGDDAVARRETAVQLFVGGRAARPGAAPDDCSLRLRLGEVTRVDA